jgi:hypothetical protein
MATALLPLPACGPLFLTLSTESTHYVVADSPESAERTLLRYASREEADEALSQARWGRDEDVYEVVTRVRRLRRRK